MHHTTNTPPATARPRSLPLPISRPRHARTPRAFSLIELLIAVMILGIGITLVATVFPVAIAHTQQTVQQSIAPSVADTAVAILKAKLDTWRDANGDGIVRTAGPRELVPTQPQEASDWPDDLPRALPGCLSDTDITANEVYYPIPALNMWRPAAFADAANWELLQNPAFGPTDPVFGENWLPLAAIIPLPHSPYPFGMNCPYTSGFGAAPDLPYRINPLDRAYPTVPTTWASGEPMDLWVDRSLDPTLPLGVLQRLNRRAFSWSAFARRLGNPDDAFPDVAPREFSVVIAVHFRADPASRFPAQRTQTGDFRDLSRPAPTAGDGSDNQAPDGIFPQPWLVFFDADDNPATLDTDYGFGRIQCHPAAARLLPPGAIFVDLENGEPHTVLTRTIDEARNIAILTLAPIDTTDDPNRPNGITGVSDYMEDHFRRVNNTFPLADFAWVFPPPVIDRSNPARTIYAADAPVIAVFRRKIIEP